MFIFWIIWSFVSYPFIWAKNKIKNLFGKNTNEDGKVL